MDELSLCFPLLEPDKLGNSHEGQSHSQQQGNSQNNGFTLSQPATLNVLTIPHTPSSLGRRIGLILRIAATPNSRGLDSRDKGGYSPCENAEIGKRGAIQARSFACKDIHDPIFMFPMHSR